jgi:hypothetical protein
MLETLGENPWKKYIHCWSCGGNHRHRDCPQRGDKERTTQSVKQVVKVEDMGRNIPRIYTTLDNKQVDIQSHMINVEGKINDKPIAILIDSRSIHSYLDPKMVEIFLLPKRKLGKYWLF